MKRMVLAALAAFSLGLGVATAATPNSHAPVQQGNSYNFLQGGGG